MVGSLDLHGTVALVTGAGSGLGRAAARGLANAGAAVVVNGRTPGRLEETAEFIRREGGQALVAVADVSDADEAEGLIAAAEAELGPLSVLVNNAGQIVSRTAVGDTSVEQWRQGIDANLTSAYLCSKFALPRLMRTRGCIVNIASIFAVVGAPHRAAYVAAKTGVVGLTRSMAADYGRHGVRVNAICPGYIETEMNQQLLSEMRATGEFDRLLEDIPLGSVGHPDDVANATLFLVSPAARWITGVALVVDGGLTSVRM